MQTPSYVSGIQLKRLPRTPAKKKILKVTYLYIAFNKLFKET
jgi:hypothetical protein